MKNNLLKRIAEIEAQFAGYLTGTEQIVIPDTAAKTLSEAREAVVAQASIIRAGLMILEEAIVEYNALGSDQPIEGTKLRLITDAAIGEYDNISFEALTLIQTQREQIETAYGLDIKQDIHQAYGSIGISKGYAEAQPLEKINVNLKSLWQFANAWADAVAIASAHEVKDILKHDSKISDTQRTELMEAFTNHVNALREFANNFERIESYCDQAVTGISPDMKPN